MAPRRKRSARSAGSRISYREPESDDSFDELDLVPDSTPPRAKSRRIVHPSPSSSRHPTQPLSHLPHQKSPGKRPVRRRNTFSRSSTTLSPKKPVSPPVPSIPSDNVIPPWSSLPYEILLQIFHHASYPLRDQALLPNPSIHWLLRAATTCKAFCGPALAALYHSPPLVDLGEPHRLLQILSRDPSSWALDYASKIKVLELHAARTLAYTVSGCGLIDLAALVARMPQLAALDITDSMDCPPFRDVWRGKRWTYPPALFDSLNATRIALKSWRWHAKMLHGQPSWIGDSSPWLTAQHESLPFQGLEELKLSHFTFEKTKPRKREETDAELPIQPLKHLGDLLSPLRQLNSLCLTSCHTEHWSPVLDCLPQDLTQLRILNCQFLSSRDLGPFLAAKGRRLQHLQLDHNQALDLAFLVDLKQSCPELQTLRMDLTYFNEITMYRDSDPLFDQLLWPDETPTWPRSLESIELLHLRKWDSEAAQMFFTSLIRSAQDLPYLRSLVIKAILNIGWRDRAGFRERWIGSLRRVFKSRSSPPQRHLASKRAFRVWKGLETPLAPAGKAAQSSNQGADNDPAQGQSSSTITEGSDAGNQRRSARLRFQEEQDSQKPSSSDTDDADDNGPDDHGELKHLHIQGLCETVDISIDNLRPSEIQFKETDFMDSEVSGDEEWTGDRPDPSSDRYAW